jgi:hypothetical protein
MTVAVPATIAHGKLHVDPSQRAALQDALLVWPDGPVTLTVGRPQATRSLQANAYYWGAVVQALADHTGYTPDEMHDVLKVKFLPKAVALNTANGRVVGDFVIGGSTTALLSFQFSDYIEQVRQWAFEALDCDIPPPDPEWRAHAEQERRDHDQRRAQREVQAGDAAVPPVEARRGPRRLDRLRNGRVEPPVDGREGGTGKD